MSGVYGSYTRLGLLYLFFPCLVLAITSLFIYLQVRSQEEIMNECQVWWTLTGNFGNMMPIDWTKTYARLVNFNNVVFGGAAYQNNSALAL